MPLPLYFLEITQSGTQFLYLVPHLSLSLCGSSRDARERERRCHGFPAGDGSPVVSALGPERLQEAPRQAARGPTRLQVASWPAGGGTPRGGGSWAGTTAWAPSAPRPWTPVAVAESSPAGGQGYIGQLICLSHCMINSWSCFANGVFKTAPASPVELFVELKPKKKKNSCC